MISDVRKQVFRTIGLTIAILFLCGAGFAQEKLSPLSNYQYQKKDYPRYQEILKEPDLQKRADLLLTFIKERQISKLLYYSAGEFMKCVNPHIEKKDFAKATSMSEAFLSLAPSLKEVQDAQIPEGVEDFLKDRLSTQKLILSSLIQIYYASGNMPKAAETAEKLYEVAPDKGYLPLLTDIYSNMKNTDKYLVYAEKIIAEFPLDQQQGYATTIQVANVYIEKKNMDKAIELLTKVMDVNGDKAPQGVTEATWNSTRAFAYGLIAAQSYTKKDWVKAIELYEKAVKFDPKKDDAYYYIGMSKWKNNDQEGAIEPFAKSAVLNKASSKQAQIYLEQLYKARHKDTLDGLDGVIAKAKSDLGIQ